MLSNFTKDFKDTLVPLVLLIVACSAMLWIVEALGFGTFTIIAGISAATAIVTTGKALRQAKTIRRLQSEVQRLEFEKELESSKHEEITALYTRLLPVQHNNKKPTRHQDRSGDSETSTSSEETVTLTGETVTLEEG
jgi:Sec-independent protein translocase protein TatA